MRPLICVVLLSLVVGCSVVKMHRLRDGWDTDGKTSIKRLAVVVQPLPDGDEAVGAMLARVARRYVHMKRDFLVKADLARAAPAERAADCADAIDALLVLHPTAKVAEGGVELEVAARLTRCSDGVELWAAEAGGSFDDRDPGLAEVAASYAKENGQQVGRWVPAAMKVLRPMLDTLPQPELTDADVEEKMTLDE